jgi:hypothetical protein
LSIQAQLPPDAGKVPTVFVVEQQAAQVQHHPVQPRQFVLFLPFHVLLSFLWLSLKELFPSFVHAHWGWKKYGGIIESLRRPVLPGGSQEDFNRGLPAAAGAFVKLGKSEFGFPSDFGLAGGRAAS